MKITFFVLTVCVAVGMIKGQEIGLGMADGMIDHST